MSLSYELTEAIQKARSARPMRTLRRSRYRFRRVSPLRRRWEKGAMIASAISILAFVAKALFR